MRYLLSKKGEFIGPSASVLAAKRIHRMLLLLLEDQAPALAYLVMPFSIRDRSDISEKHLLLQVSHTERDTVLERVEKSASA